MEYLLRGWYKSKAYINSNPKVNDKETGKVCGSVELCDPTHAAPGHWFRAWCRSHDTAGNNSNLMD